jgi:hypothetical protein
MTAPLTLVPAGLAGAAAYAYEGGRTDEEALVLIGGASAVGLGVSLMAVEQNYVWGGLLAAVGAYVAYSTMRR